MPFVPLPDGAQVELVHVLDGSVCEVVFVFQKRALGPPIPLPALGALISNWWRTQVLPNLSVHMSYLRYRVTDISFFGAIPLQVDIIPPQPGSTGGGPQPASVAVRIGYIVEVPPGGLRGCTFVPGIPILHTTGNRYHQELRELLFEAFVALIDLAAFNGWKWVVWSKWHQGVLRTVAEGYGVSLIVFRSPYVSQRRSRLHNDPL